METQGPPHPSKRESGEQLWATATAKDLFHALLCATAGRTGLHLASRPTMDRAVGVDAGHLTRPSEHTGGLAPTPSVLWKAAPNPEVKTASKPPKEWTQIA